MMKIPPHVFVVLGLLGLIVNFVLRFVVHRPTFADPVLGLAVAFLVAGLGIMAWTRN
ncbi:hypothetical protein [Deinococcus aquiradiocola]|nr:hypothetical protein [Deinococcus aquiradiocola]